MDWEDRSVLEASSWRLASELARRHPGTTRLIRTHPGGGQYDCLCLIGRQADQGNVQLNRNGRIHVLQRFDEQPIQGFDPVGWDEYLRSDPRLFLARLEDAAGLRAPDHVPPATPETLTYRLLAAITVTAMKSVHPMGVEMGYIDSSGSDSGPNEALRNFTGIPPDLLRAQADDLFGEPGYRFWIVTRDAVPVLAVEQGDGTAWTTHRHQGVDLMRLYEDSRRNVVVTALEMLRMVDTV